MDIEHVMCVLYNVITNCVTETVTPTWSLIVHLPDIFHLLNCVHVMQYKLLSTFEWDVIWDTGQRIESIFTTDAMWCIKDMPNIIVAA